MFNTESDFDEQSEAIEYATHKGLLVSIGDDIVAVNPENGKRYLLDYELTGFYWRRT
jgi:hypothetical protein